MLALQLVVGATFLFDPELILPSLTGLVWFCIKSFTVPLNPQGHLEKLWIICEIFSSFPPVCTETLFFDFPSFFFLFFNSMQILGGRSLLCNIFWCLDVWKSVISTSGNQTCFAYSKRIPQIK